MNVSKHGSPRIITFSRRTDPAFHSDAFLRGLDDGFIDVPNPFSGKPYRVSLLPEDIAILTFWTKDPASVIIPADECTKRSIHIAFFITLNAYPGYIESNTPPEHRTLNAMEEIAAKYSPDAVFWRYDPVIFTKSLGESWHINNFERLCRSLSGCTRRVIFSLAHIDGAYASVRSRLAAACEKSGDPLDMPKVSDRNYYHLKSRAIQLFGNLRAVASGYGIDHAEVCCSPKLNDDDRSIIPQGSCLSRYFLDRITPLPDIPVRGTRKGSKNQDGYAPCGCLESVDIGTKCSCRFGCTYCYANRKCI
ncbi:MAG TPA: DUF1848 family protein [Spirochaetota bacterium]|nr:DUF1848 family protein [Spirochaetota bacterium]